MSRLRFYNTWGNEGGVWSLALLVFWYCAGEPGQEWPFCRMFGATILGFGVEVRL